MCPKNWATCQTYLGSSNSIWNLALVALACWDIVRCPLVLLCICLNRAPTCGLIAQNRSPMWPGQLLQQPVAKKNIQFLFKVMCNFIHTSVLTGTFVIHPTPNNKTYNLWPSKDRNDVIVIWHQCYRKWCAGLKISPSTNFSKIHCSRQYNTNIIMWYLYDLQSCYRELCITINVTFYKFHWNPVFRPPHITNAQAKCIIVQLYASCLTLQNKIHCTDLNLCGISNEIKP